MKYAKKALMLCLAMVCLCACLLPLLENTAAAAAKPVISFTNISSQNPIMDMHLKFDIFSAGGPFTVTLESKCENVQGWTNPLTGKTEANPNIVIYVEGTKYASTTKQDADGVSARAKLNVLPAGWQKSTFTFQNVGTINVSGTDIPGNLLRTYFWQTTGTVYLRNVKIVNAAGTTVYDMNTDPDLLGLMSQMQSAGMTESDISNVASINEYCLWCAPGSFGVAGDYYGTVHIDNGTGGNTTSSSTRRPGSQTPTSSSTTKPTISSSTSKPTTKPTTQPTTKPTTQPTVKPTTRPTTKPTTQPTTNPILQNPCANGHIYSNGACTVCGVSDPNYIAPTQPGTMTPVTPDRPMDTPNNGDTPILPGITFDPNYDMGSANPLVGILLIGGSIALIVGVILLILLIIIIKAIVKAVKKKKK